MSITDFLQLGSVETLPSGQSRARLRKRVGEHFHRFTGPRRWGKPQAEEDLDAIRAAAEQGPDPWSAMKAEAQRLRERAEFDGRVAATVSSFTGAAEPSLLPAVEDMQPPDSPEFDDDFGNELWQEIDDEGRLPPSYAPPPRIPVADPENAVEATALLSIFRPARMSIEVLKKLLDAKADPNVTLKGDIHPLMKVMTFAEADSAGPMRDLLLQAGAVESSEFKERWELRQASIASAEDWMRKFHCDPRGVHECV